MQSVAQKKQDFTDLNEAGTWDSLSTRTERFHFDYQGLYIRQGVDPGSSKQAFTQVVGEIDFTTFIGTRHGPCAPAMGVSMEPAAADDVATSIAAYN